MKNQFFALTAAIGVILVGGIPLKPELLNSVQAMTVEDRNGILVIGVGESVRSKDQTYRVERGTKFYFECKDEDTGSDYNYIRIKGAIDETLSSSNGSRSKTMVLNDRGTYKFQIDNVTRSFNETITLVVY